MLLAKILLRGLRVSVAAVVLLGRTACLAALRGEWKRLRAGHNIDLSCVLRAACCVLRATSNAFESYLFVRHFLTDALCA